METETRKTIYQSLPWAKLTQVVEDYINLVPVRIELDSEKQKQKLTPPSCFFSGAASHLQSSFFLTKQHREWRNTGDSPSQPHSAIPSSSHLSLPHHGPGTWSGSPCISWLHHDNRIIEGTGLTCLLHLFILLPVISSINAVNYL